MARLPQKHSPQTRSTQGSGQFTLAGNIEPHLGFRARLSTTLATRIVPIDRQNRAIFPTPHIIPAPPSHILKRPNITETRPSIIGAKTRTIDSRTTTIETRTGIIETRTRIIFTPAPDREQLM